MHAWDLSREWIDHFSLIQFSGSSGFRVGKVGGKRGGGDRVQGPTREGSIPDRELYARIQGDRGSVARERRNGRESTAGSTGLRCVDGERWTSVFGATIRPKSS